MAKRPAFQFYPADWVADKNLRRCTKAEKGEWIDIMCLLHDSDEYGILRWTLADIAAAVGSNEQNLSGLVRKGVLKGCDYLDMDTTSNPQEVEMVSIGHDIGGSMGVPTMPVLCSPLTYTHSRKHKTRAGEVVELIPEQPGPIWYCSRMVRDEFLRSEKGKHGQKSRNNPNVPQSRNSPKVDMDTIGHDIGGSMVTGPMDTIIGSPSSSSSSSPSVKRREEPIGSSCPASAPGTAEPHQASKPPPGSDPDPKPEPDPPLDPEPLLEFPCRKPEAIWHLTANLVEEWQEVFPEMDILAESRKARAWLREKPGVRLKTYRGMVSFLGGWLRRSNDRGSFSKRHAGSSPTHESSSSEGFLGRYLAALEDLEERHRTKKISTEIYESVRPEVEASQTDEALVKAMTRAKELR